MDNLTIKQIETAVDWWADKLKGCKTSGLSSGERQNSANDAYQMAEVLMALTKPEINNTQVERFKFILCKLLTKLNPRTLGIDYYPCKILRDALDAAEIDNSLMGVLPIKTYMNLSDGKVSVSYGYGAPYEDISLPERKGA